MVLAQVLLSLDVGLQLAVIVQQPSKNSLLDLLVIFLFEEIVVEELD